MYASVFIYVIHTHMEIMFQQTKNWQTKKKELTHIYDIHAGVQLFRSPAGGGGGEGTPRHGNGASYLDLAHSTITSFSC